MAASRTSERLHRLTGGDRGGGLPLPLLFTAILEELLDRGGATTARINEITESALDFKAATVYMTWPSFEDLAADVLEQMEYRKVVKQEDGVWRLDKFVMGEYIEVIPGGKGRQRDGTTVWGKAEREARSRQSMIEFNAASVIERPNPVQHDVVARLRESAANVGHQYPVLTDRNGRIIDGHHRIQADPNWPKLPARRKDGTPVETEAEMLALIRDLDIHRPPLSDETQAAIDRILGELAGTNEIKRDRVAAELKRDASRSNREIAEAVGVHHDLVVEVRQELADSANIHAYQFTAGRGHRPGKHSAACWCGEGEEAPKPRPSATSGPPPARKTDNPALRAEIRRQLVAGVCGDDINQSELCNRFGVSQWPVEVAVRKETEEFLREQLSAAPVAAPPTGDPTPSTSEPPRQVSPPPASPPAVPEPQPEPGPAPIDYGDMIHHLQAVANLEPDRIITALESSGDHATGSELFKWAAAARDVVEYLTELLDEGESYEQEEELGKDLG